LSSGKQRKPMTEAAKKTNRNKPGRSTNTDTVTLSVYMVILGAVLIWSLGMGIGLLLGMNMSSTTEPPRGETPVTEPQEGMLPEELANAFALYAQNAEEAGGISSEFVDEWDDQYSIWNSSDGSVIVHQYLTSPGQFLYIDLNQKELYATAFYTMDVFGMNPVDPWPATALAFWSAEGVGAEDIAPEVLMALPVLLHNNPGAVLEVSSSFNGYTLSYAPAVIPGVSPLETETYTLFVRLNTEGEIVELTDQGGETMGPFSFTNNSINVEGYEHLPPDMLLVPPNGESFPEEDFAPNGESNGTA